MDGVVEKTRDENIKELKALPLKDSDISALEGLLDRTRCKAVFTAHKNLENDLFKFITNQGTLNEAIKRLNILDADGITLLGDMYAPLVRNTFQMGQDEKQFEHMPTIFDLIIKKGNQVVNSGDLNLHNVVAVIKHKGGGPALAVSMLNEFFGDDKTAANKDAFSDESLNSKGIKPTTPRTFVPKDSPMNDGSKKDNADDDAAQTGCIQRTKARIAGCNIL